MRKAGSRSVLNPSQLALIHLAKKQLGMDEDAYRQMLRSVAGASSAAELDSDGLDRVMEHLRSCGFEKTPGRHEASGFVAYKQKWRALVGERPGMATSGQLAAIEVTWDSMQSYWMACGSGDRDKALRGFLAARFKTTDLRFLNFEAASKVIYALRAIKKRRKQ